MRPASTIAWPALAAATLVWACGSEPKGESLDTAATGGRPIASPVKTAAVPGGCELVPAAEIERIIGQLESPPRAEGRGCWYYRPVDSLTAKWAHLATPGQELRPGLFVEVDVSGASVVSARGVAAAREVMGAGGTAPEAPPSGWDWVGTPLGRAGFSGRTGHVTVTVALNRLKLPKDTLRALAERVRDRLPDHPFAHPAAGRSGSPAPGRDPCLLTREEVEPVLGKLVVPPFRTRDGSPLADPAGTSCAYFTSGHRVLVLTPEWTYGRLALDAERMVGGLVSQVADVEGVAAADTLEGPWDEAAVALSGDLVLLKGSRALTVGYLMSSTDAAGAIRLSGPALQRLAEVPEPTRPKVAADGCVPEALVSEIVDIPLRLATNAMNVHGTCDYEFEADPGVRVELSVQPARAAEELFAQLQSTAKVFLGASAQADAIDVGEGGWAYTGRSGGEAAAKAGGKVYHARIRKGISSIPHRSDAMVRLVERMAH